jgi:hypothetical protein
MKGSKLRSAVYWQRALKHKGVELVGHKSKGHMFIFLYVSRLYIYFKFLKENNANEKYEILIPPPNVHYEAETLQCLHIRCQMPIYIPAPVLNGLGYDSQEMCTCQTVTLCFMSVLL